MKKKYIMKQDVCHVAVYYLLLIDYRKIDGNHMIHFIKWQCNILVQGKTNTYVHIKNHPTGIYNSKRRIIPLSIMNTHTYQGSFKVIFLYKQAMASIMLNVLYLTYFGLDFKVGTIGNLYRKLHHCLIH